MSLRNQSSTIKSSEVNFIRITKKKREFEKQYLKGKWPKFFKKVKDHYTDSINSTDLKNDNYICK